MAFFRVEVTHQTFTITAHFEDMWRNKYLKMKPYKGKITALCRSPIINSDI